MILRAVVPATGIHLTFLPRQESGRRRQMPEQAMPVLESADARGW